MLVERDDVVEDSHRPWVNWNRSKFWLSAILADTSISHGKSRRHMIAAAMIGRWDSHCRLFLWTPLPVHPEELGHGDRYIDSTLFSPQAQVWPFEHIPTETFETMKHSEAFEFLSILMSQNFYSGAAGIFSHCLVQEEAERIDLDCPEDPVRKCGLCCKRALLGSLPMYVCTYVCTYIYIICIRFIVSVYNDLATEGYLARICLYTWGSSTFVRGECGGVRFWARFWICSASIFFHIVSHHSVLLGSYDFIWQGSWAVSIRIWILFWQAARLVAGDAGLTVATLAGKGAAQAFKELLYDLKNDLLLCLFWSSDFM